MKARRFCAWSVLLTLVLGMFVRVSAAPPDIVLYASDATVRGAWSKTSGSGAAGGQLLSTADNGWSTVNAPLASPNDWFEATFTAPANTPYHVWLRLRATADTKYNDSVWAQFSDATDANGTAVYQIGSGSGLLINLENCFACGVAGWGWQDKAYWFNQASTIAFSTAGSHTIRVQTREDGVQVDQIVLSPSTYLSSAPGQVMNDSTIVAKPPTAPAAASTPFNRTPAAIPGTIQAQDFDNGGEGFAYHDTTAGNTGGAYRQSDVDLEPSADGGNDVGWIAVGEWINYTVNVGAAGSYAVTFRVASSGQGGSFHLEMNGTNVSSAITVPNTGGWQSWQSVTKTVTLDAGQQVARLVMDTAGDGGGIGNISSMAFAAASIASTGAAPFTGTPAAIPGRIDAANFDNGGEGVAYHDTTAGNAGGAYRSTDVDLQSSTDGGYNIGWIGAGEWVTYTVNVASAGSYTAQLRMASPNGASIRLGFNGSGGNVLTPVQVPATGAWQAWTTVNVPVTLSAGQQVMMLIFDTNGLNVTSVNVVSAGTPSGGLPGAPNSPGVADGSVGVTLPPNLSWQASGATTYDVRLDSSNPPMGLWAANLATNSYTPSPLNSGIRYYWQVTAKNSNGSTAGPVWSFTTTSSAPPMAPGTPSLPGVADGSVGVTLPPNLSWQSAGATSYDVRLDTSNPPTGLWASNISTNSFAPSPLTGATRYYWQVVARNNNGSTTGPVWSFTTAGSPTPPPSSSTFRMMTWNIHHGYTTGNVYNLLTQVQFIVAQNPDVIALEEVQTWDENQPPKLKSLLEQLTGQSWTLVWAPVNNSAGTEGNVILTRLPVVTSTFQQLHATSDWTVLLANRSVAQATVLVNSVPVNVFATHLDYANTTYRTIQEQQLMPWLWNFAGPRLVGGDFNSWWGESWITTMETQHTDTWHDVTGLQDLGYTVDQAVRFDYVFRSMDGNWRVTPTNCYVPVTYLSDHNPVVADFKVK